MNNTSAISGGPAPLQAIPSTPATARTTSDVTATLKGARFNASYQNTAGTPSPAAGAFTAPPRTRHAHNDGHTHHHNYAQQGSRPVDLLPIMDAINLRHTILAPIPTNQVAICCGEEYHPAKGLASTAPNYYLPEDIKKEKVLTSEQEREIVRATGPLVYNTEADSRTAQMYNALTDVQKERFDPAITGLVLGNHRVSEDLLRKLALYPGVFSLVGEVTLEKEVVKAKLDPRAQPDLDTHFMPMVDLIKTCGEIGMPFLLHCDIDVLPDQREPDSAPRYLEGIRRLVGHPDCRNTTIIWAHLGGVGKYSHARPNHLDYVSAVLDEFPHVYLDTSWDVVAQQFLQKDYVNKDQTVDEAKVTRMKAFVEKYSERLIFGSDTLAPQRASDWSSTIDTFKPLLDVLAPDAKHNLLLKNYEDVIMGARPKVRAYEKHCLPYAYIGIEMRQDRAEEDVKFVRSQVQMGIAYGRALMEAELSGSSPPTRPPALRSIEDIEKRAYGIVDDSKQKASETTQPGMSTAPTVQQGNSSVTLDADANNYAWKGAPAKL